MLILAFDCSSPAGSVTLLEGSHVLAWERLDPAKRSANTLAPAIARALLQARRQPSEVKLVATTVGPGSFTGLRVGVTLAKTLAYALKCDLIGLNTLDVMAAQVYESGLCGESGIIHAVLDAQRKELFVGRFRVGRNDEGPIQRLDDGQTILPADSWLTSLQAGDTVTGSGLARWQDMLPQDVVVVPDELHAPNAVTIGQLALREFQAGRRDDLWTLAPLYIRLSYADEKQK